ncbi:MAG: energy transducer TonB [Saprospiraceae bacterium]|nr:energy transducer TonB [Saprospiraceae bacterium]
MKTLIFSAVISLLPAFTVFSQVYIDFKEYDWEEIESCTQCQPCRGELSDKKEVEKRIAFRCKETLIETWKLNKISFSACDSIHVSITNSAGEKSEFNTEAEALKTMCALTYRFCPSAIPAKYSGMQGGYSAQLAALLEAEYSDPARLASITEESLSGNQFFKMVEVMPILAGCDQKNISEEMKKKCSDYKLIEFVGQELRYPDIARQNGIEGTVVISLVIEKNGTIGDATIVRDIGGGCGEEALRVVQLMNKKKIRWSPGMVRGKPVRVQFYLPVKYKLS